MEFYQTVVDSRVDQQVVAGSAAGGTGDPVEMPGLPDLLAYAVSTGAVTQTVNQNVVTLSANGDGVYRFLAGQNPACPGSDGQPVNSTSTHAQGCPPPSWAHNLAVSAAFNIGSTTQTVTGQSAETGATQSALAAVTGRTFSSANARYAISNPRSPESPQNAEAFQARFRTFSQFHGPGVELLAYITSLLQSHIGEADLEDFGDLASQLRTDARQNRPLTVIDAWHELNSSLIKNPRFSGSRKDFEMESVRIALGLLFRKDATTDQKLSNLIDNYLEYLAKDSVTSADQVYDPMLTIEYTYSRPPLEPDLHTVTFSGSFSPGAKTSSNPGTLTGNLGVSTYTKAQPTDTKGNTGFLRNLQAAAQFDRSWAVSQTHVQVSIGGYLQYQISPGVISVPSGSTIPGTSISVPADAMTLLAPKGWIAAAESKVTLHIPNMAAPIPLGFTYSNRTDLLKGSEVRAHIAFSFDTFPLAALAAKKP